MLKPSRHEEFTLAPDLWLRAQALENWLNEKSREGWSLSSMDETLCTLRHDGTERRYRAFALREKDEEAFTRQCAELGWRQVARSGEVHVFEAVGDAPGQIDDAPSLRVCAQAVGAAGAASGAVRPHSDLHLPDHAPGRQRL